MLAPRVEVDRVSREPDLSKGSLRNIGAVRDKGCRKLASAPTRQAYELAAREAQRGAVVCGLLIHAATTVHDHVSKHACFCEYSIQARRRDAISWKPETHLVEGVFPPSKAVPSWLRELPLLEHDIGEGFGDVARHLVGDIHGGFWVLPEALADDLHGGDPGSEQVIGGADALDQCVHAPMQCDDRHRVQPSEVTVDFASTEFDALP